jgi:hypothetical protein
MLSIFFYINFYSLAQTGEGWGEGDNANYFYLALTLSYKREGKPESFSSYFTNGNKAIILDRLIAFAKSLWCLEQVPVFFLG